MIYQLFIDQVQLTAIEPKTAAFFTHIVRQFCTPGDDLVIHHLDIAIQASHNGMRFQGQLRLGRRKIRRVTIRHLRFEKPSGFADPRTPPIPKQIRYIFGLVARTYPVVDHYRKQ